jgi:hypothetical protein
MQRQSVGSLAVGLLQFCRGGSIEFTIDSFIPFLSPVTIPQVVAANENVFSVNLPGKIMYK